MIYLFLCLVVLAVLEIWVVKQLVERASFIRLVRTNDLQSLSVYEKNSYIEIFKEKIAVEKWKDSENAEERCFGSLRWVMNKVFSVENKYNRDPLRLLYAVESGQGTGCSGMALLYNSVLAAVGIQSRTISLSRNIFDEYDSHETVEVFLNGKWVVLDPTFHISFSDSHNLLLSAQEIKRCFLSGKYKEINVKFHGEVAYPPRTWSYYIDIFPLFNNVFVVDKGSENFFSKIPPLRYWFGPKKYYERLSKESVSHLEFAQIIYFMFVVVVPSLILVIGLFMAVKMFLL